MARFNLLSVEIDGYSITYYDGGEGEPVVLIHGYGDSKISFLQAAAGLTGHGRVLLPEVPGFGETRLDANRNYSIRSQVKFFHLVFQKLGLKRFHLGGNSMGGHIAAAYTLAYPEQVKSLILLNATGMYVDEQFYLGSEPIESDSEFDTYMDKIFVEKPFVPGPFKKYFIQKSRDTLDWRNRVSKDIREGADYLLDSRISKIQAPTLILWGRQDRIVRINVGEAFDEGIPNAKWVVFDPGGHSPQYEFPKRTAKTILEFIRNHSSE